MVDRVCIPKYEEKEFPDKHISYLVEISNKRTTWIVHHRYNDFVALNDEITKSKLKVPEKLPPKNTFGTLSKEKIEQRRTALEKYLKILVLNEDQRISSHPALLTFLKITPEDIVDQEIESLDVGTWMDRYRALKDLVNTISAHLTERERKILNGDDEKEESGIARKKMGILNSKTSALANELQNESNSTQKDLFSRQDKLAELKNDFKQLDHRYRNPNIQSERREQLFGGSKKERVFGMETEKTKNLDEGEIVQVQRQAIKEQDQQLEQLMSVLQRQAHIAKAIGTELDEQNAMLDDVNAQADRTQAKLKTAGRQVVKIISS